MEIKVHLEDEIKEVSCQENQSLMDALRDQGIYIAAYCNGRGVCGKCGICVEKGELLPSEEDLKIFTKEQIEKGYRLSCKAYPSKDLEISLLSADEDDFEVLSSDGAVSSEKETVLEHSQSDSLYGIAVDIGTTTISMDLLDLSDGQVYGRNNRINRQRAFGADVISRIQASVNGEKEALRLSIVHDLTEGFEAMLHESGIAPEKIVKITIGANTTMCHLLLGYDCDTLGVFPFEPVNIKTVEKSFEEVFESTLLQAKVVVLPGISTYVGADISSGMYVCGFNESEKPVMLIDLGTNGEMAIGNKEHILCTSTAAGPAFEGGNISCGTGSVKGAICAVKMQSPEEISFTTIGDGEPVGICGTGVLDITAELVANEIVDETGLLDDDYFDDGIKITTAVNGDDIIFTQKDVREIQLAKAAVRAGIEVLLKKCQLTYEDVETVYLAGGFGFRLNIEKAVSIGLLPEEFADKIKIAGNTSLQGAVQCLLNENGIQTMEAMIAKCEEVSLGSDADFNNAYMDAMYFE